MVWTEITRPQYRREGMRYESDTTDGEWLVSRFCRLPQRSGVRAKQTCEHW